jgi:hypothetical protein
MSENELSKEEKILRAVRTVLVNVAKDTATEPGIKHPLTDRTINGIRDCLAMISNREQELAELAGRTMDMRPQFPGDAKPKEEVVVPLHRSGLARGDGKKES